MLSQGLIQNCPDCGCCISQKHHYGCGNSQCPRCGWQEIGCNCIYEFSGISDICEIEKFCPNGPTDEMYAAWDAEFGDKRLPWMGAPYGSAECVEYGWWVKWDQERSRWVECSADESECVPNYGKLRSCRWSIEDGRFYKD